MPMPRRDKNPLNDLRAELEEMRKDGVKNRKDIVALKARIVDAEQRLAKAETALGTVAKSGAMPDVDEEPPDEQQPETE
jgi:predicted  nucleic acid-binding Zn-ribbon protein